MSIATSWSQGHDDSAEQCGSSHERSTLEEPPMSDSRSNELAVTAPAKTNVSARRDRPLLSFIAAMAHTLVVLLIAVWLISYLLFT
jgi:hypothetical protein